MKYFHIYDDGLRIWPIGIICINRIRGFGLGFFRVHNDDVLIGIGILFKIHIINVNWKAFRSKKALAATEKEKQE